MISGLCAGIGGIILSSRLDAGNGLFGANDLLQAVAAVVIGGTSLFGGVGNVLGTAIGVLIIESIYNGMILLNVPDFWQLIVVGGIVIAASVVDQLAKAARLVVPVTRRSESRAEVMLEARGIAKSYGAVKALDGVDLELRRGEVRAVGDTEAGKTTLVKCLSGVHRPDSGRSSIDGRDPGTLTGGVVRACSGSSRLPEPLARGHARRDAELVPRTASSCTATRSPRGLGLMNKRRMYRETDEHLQQLGLKVEAQHQVSALFRRTAADDRRGPRHHLGAAHRHARRARRGARRAAVAAGARLRAHDG